MSLIDSFAEFFVQSFAISAPTPDKKRRAVFFIFGLIFATLAVFAAAILFFLHWLKA
jgi:hypothetical protein